MTIRLFFTKEGKAIARKEKTIMPFSLKQFLLTGNHLKIYFLNSRLIVLFLFIVQLLLAPLTFTNLWHCPMMVDNNHQTMSEHAMSAMDMHKMKGEHQKNMTHSGHGIFICPLCNSFALPSPLLNHTPVLPSLSVVTVIYRYKGYLAQAPPVLPVKIHYSRAPPLL
ncbi:DUF2946 family protein [Commensalibacter oyaizuii]|uniref:DUF2946 domain-containing protein n=1 Tax=Commensalibacter oyaizuii TaxID=3043873 RepID=A0ABT6Q4B0_9PROT|nr:DUF2946 family protein [Commensalibacter sp. TBRC 16381]MDI2091406.1 hypothetical protein [Commensalibacter sp. TBRC 16381]